MAEADKSWRAPANPGAYPGPPVTSPPEPHWRPERLDPVPAPRELPRVDDDAVDEQERRAARLTYGVGLAALAVLLILAISRFA